MTGLARHSAMSRRLHWIAAAAIAVTVPLGFAAHEAGGGVLLAHMALGGLVVVLSALRAARALRALTPPAKGSSPFETRAALIVHWALRLIPLALGVSGVAMIAMVGLPQLMESRAVLTDLPQAAVHGALGKLLIALVLLHVLAALRHALAGPRQGAVS